MTARREDGFTLLETILAIAVCGIVLAALASVNVTSLQQTRDGGLRAQATQVLDSLGRRVVGGQDNALLPGSGDEVTFAYGEVGSVVAIDGGVPADRYRATIARTGTQTTGTTTLARYRIEVCFEGAGGESCVTGSTLARRND